MSNSDYAIEANWIARAGTYATPGWVSTKGDLAKWTHRVLTGYLRVLSRGGRTMVKDSAERRALHDLASARVVAMQALIDAPDAEA